MAELFDSKAMVTCAILACTFMQYLIAFCSRTEAASDIISGVVLDLAVAKALARFGDSG